MAMITAVSEKLPDVLFAKFDANMTVKTKKDVTEAVNNVSTQDVCEEKAADEKKHKGTGGGPAKLVNYTLAEEAMLPLIEPTSIHGVVGVPGSEQPSTSAGPAAVSALPEDEQQEDVTVLQKEVQVGKKRKLHYQSSVAASNVDEMLATQKAIRQDTERIANSTERIANSLSELVAIAKMNFTVEHK